MRLRRCGKSLFNASRPGNGMSMADDKRQRAQRSSEPMRRGGRPTDEGSTGDPLAELARLIGQSDPFSDHGRRDGRDSAPRNAQSKAPASDWRRTAASMPPYEAAEEPRLDTRYDERHDERPSQYRSEPQFADDDYHPREDERMYGAREQGSTYYE